MYIFSNDENQSYLHEEWNRNREKLNNSTLQLESRDVENETRTLHTAEQSRPPERFDSM